MSDSSELCQAHADVVSHANVKAMWGSRARRILRRELVNVMLNVMESTVSSEHDLLSPAVVTGWETENKYRVRNTLGQDVYFARESTCTLKYLGGIDCPWCVVGADLKARG